MRSNAANPGVPTHLDVEALSKKDRELLEELDPAFEFDETLRKHQIADRIVAAGPRPFRAPTAAGWVFVHPDLKHSGSWRATFFDDDWEPYSHMEFPADSSEESFAAAVKEITLDAKFDRMEWYVGNPGEIDPALYEYIVDCPRGAGRDQPRAA
jgi:hypothetical protein